MCGDFSLTNVASNQVTDAGVHDFLASITQIEKCEFSNFNQYAEDEFYINIKKAQRVIDCKYQYDDIGSYIFKLQCQQDEYYLTRAEKGILLNHFTEILEKSGCEFIVDLGAGSGEKVIAALSHIGFKNRDNLPLTYMPIDINYQVLIDCINSFRAEALTLPIHAICGCYPNVLDLTACYPGAKMFASFGSSISNQEMEDIEKFLLSIHRVAGKNDKLLLGVDVTADVQAIELAYNDKHNVNAIHNLNVLNHVNRRHQANFDVDEFEAVSVFNRHSWRIESFVVSKKEQQVSCFNGHLKLPLKSGEKIRTEISQKFKRNEFISFVESLGFRETASWTDKDNHFLVSMFDCAL